jgi:hypothetical protein
VPPRRARSRTSGAGTGAAVAGAGLAPLSAAGAAAGVASVKTPAETILRRIVRAVRAVIRRLSLLRTQRIYERLSAAGVAEDDVKAVMRREVAREREFQARAARRVEVGTRLALNAPDPSARAAAVEAVIRRERVYARQRSEAQAVRAFHAVDRIVLRRASPDGAFWLLGDAAQHTPDCLMMANRFWPWEILEKLPLPLHTGCQCRLISFGDAIRTGRMTPGEMMSKAAARKAAAPVIAFHRDEEERAEREAVRELEIREALIERADGNLLALLPLESDYLLEAAYHRWRDFQHPRDSVGRFIRTIFNLPETGGPGARTVHLDSRTRVTKDTDGSYRVVRSGAITSGFRDPASAARAALDASARGTDEDSVGGTEKFSDLDTYLRSRGLDPDAPVGYREKDDFKPRRIGPDTAREIEDRIRFERAMAEVDAKDGVKYADKRARALKAREENYRRKIEQAERPVPPPDPDPVDPPPHINPDDDLPPVPPPDPPKPDVVPPERQISAENPLKLKVSRSTLMSLRDDTEGSPVHEILKRKTNSIEVHSPEELEQVASAMRVHSSGAGRGNYRSALARTADKLENAGHERRSGIQVDPSADPTLIAAQKDVDELKAEVKRLDSLILDKDALPSLRRTPEEIRQLEDRRAEKLRALTVAKGRLEQMEAERRNPNVKDDPQLRAAREELAAAKEAVTRIEASVKFFEDRGEGNTPGTEQTRRNAEEARQKVAEIEARIRKMEEARIGTEDNPQIAAAEATLEQHRKELAQWEAAHAQADPKLKALNAENAAHIEKLKGRIKEDEKRLEDLRSRTPVHPSNQAAIEDAEKDYEQLTRLAAEAQRHFMRGRHKNSAEREAASRAADRARKDATTALEKLEALRRGSDPDEQERIRLTGEVARLQIDMDAAHSAFERLPVGSEERTQANSRIIDIRNELAGKKGELKKLERKATSGQTHRRPLRPARFTGDGGSDFAASVYLADGAKADLTQEDETGVRIRVRRTGSTALAGGETVELDVPEGKNPRGIADEWLRAENERILSKFLPGDRHPLTEGAYVSPGDKIVARFGTEEILAVDRFSSTDPSAGGDPGARALVRNSRGQVKWMNLTKIAQQSGTQFEVGDGRSVPILEALPEPEDLPDDGTDAAEMRRRVAKAHREAFEVLEAEVTVSNAEHARLVAGMVAAQNPRTLAQLGADLRWGESISKATSNPLPAEERIRELEIELEEVARGPGPVIGRKAELRAEIRALKKQIGAQRARAIAQAIAEVRPGFGEGKLSGKRGSSRLNPLLDAAVECLPKEWTDGQKKPNLRAVTGRASYCDADKQVNCRDGDYSTMLHEFGHFLEYHVPGITEAEKAFHEERTEGEPLVKLKDLLPHSGYKRDEKTKEDRFSDPYVGKVYGYDAWEILTMGLQLVFYEEQSRREGHVRREDVDHANWVLGLLMAL